MTNRYFNNTQNLLDGTKARAGAVEAEFDSVTAGFDVVQTEIDAKAPLASPALTGSATAVNLAVSGTLTASGTATVPVPAAGDDSTKAAPTQWVRDLMDSLVSNPTLPAQTGYETGDVLTTDGATLTWLRNPLARYDAAITGRASDLTLTNASGSQSVGFTHPRYSVVLPDATTMSGKGAQFALRNTGAASFPVRNASREIVGFVPPHRTCIVTLVSKATAAGVWDLAGGSPFALADYFTLSGASSNLTVIELATGVFFIATSTGTGGGNAVIYDSTTGTWGSSTAVSSSPSAALYWIKLDNTNILQIAETSGANGVSGRVLSISGTTITQNTEATASGDGISGTPTITALSTTLAVALYNTGAVTKARAFSVSGTTVTIGSSVSMVASAQTPQWIEALTATRALVVYHNGTSSLTARTLDVAGTVITANATATVGMTGPVFIEKFTDTGRWLARGLNSGGTQHGFAILSVTGTTCAFTAVTATTNFGSGTTNSDRRCWKLDGSRFLVQAGGSNYCAVVKDNAGAVALGGEVNMTSNVDIVAVGSAFAVAATNNASTAYALTYSISDTTLTRVFGRVLPISGLTLNLPAGAPQITYGLNQSQPMVLYTAEGEVYGEAIVAPCNVPTGVSVFLNASRYSDGNNASKNHALWFDSLNGFFAAEANTVVFYGVSKR